MPPVATITSTPSSDISASISGIVGSSTTCRQPSGRARGDRRLGEQVDRLGAHPARQRVRRHHDGVARHERQQDLEVDGRDRVRRRREREHDAGRLGHRDDLGLRVDLDPDEVVARVALHHAARARLVLAPLVLGHAHAGLLDRHDGEPFGVLVRHLGDRLDHAARPLAVVLRERGGRPAGALEHHPGALDHAGTATSASAWPIATRARSSTSSTMSGPSRMPGLNCSTRGSSVEKIAHTPFS